MIVTAFVSMIAEVMILLLSITAPVFIFCLMYGFLRPMFNNWLQNVFAAILTILFSALSLRIVVNYLNSRLDIATQISAQANIVELGAQVCLAGICAAILVYLSAKLAASLAGASATVSMQGLAAVGIGAGMFGAGKLAAGAGKQTTRAIQDNIRGWRDANAGKPGSGPGYSAAKARKYAIEQMIARNEARRLAHSREAAIQQIPSLNLSSLSKIPRSPLVKNIACFHSTDLTEEKSYETPACAGFAVRAFRLRPVHLSPGIQRAGSACEYPSDYGGVKPS